MQWSLECPLHGRPVASIHDSKTWAPATAKTNDLNLRRTEGNPMMDGTLGVEFCPYWSMDAAHNGKGKNTNGSCKTNPRTLANQCFIFCDVVGNGKTTCPKNPRMIYVHRNPALATLVQHRFTISSLLQMYANMHGHPNSPMCLAQDLSWPWHHPPSRWTRSRNNVSFLDLFVCVHLLLRTINKVVCCALCSFAACALRSRCFSCRSCFFFWGSKRTTTEQQ
jgi:hypothetical protein